MLQVAEYGGMEVIDFKKLMDPEGESRRPKQIYADLGLENRALSDMIAIKACHKRWEAVEFVMAER